MDRAAADSDIALIRGLGNAATAWAGGAARPAHPTPASAVAPYSIAGPTGAEGVITLLAGASLKAFLRFFCAYPISLKDRRFSTMTPPGIATIPSEMKNVIAAWVETLSTV
jgi:hypothetical protein